MSEFLEHEPPAWLERGYQFVDHRISLRQVEQNEPCMHKVITAVLDWIAHDIVNP